MNSKGSKTGNLKKIDRTGRMRLTAKVNRRLIAGTTLMLAFTVACFAVQWPYRTAAFMLDDVAWLVHAGLIFEGNNQFGMFEYCFAFDGEHCYPLWKLSYYLVWRVCGFAPEYWRYLIWVMHSLSATLIFLLLSNGRFALPIGGLVAA